MFSLAMLETQLSGGRVKPIAIVHVSYMRLLETNRSTLRTIFNFRRKITNGDRDLSKIFNTRLRGIKLHDGANLGRVPTHNEQYA